MVIYDTFCEKSNYLRTISLHWTLMQNGSGTYMTEKVVLDKAEKDITLRFIFFGTDSGKSMYYIIMPFGNDKDILPYSYFDIESIVFFENEFAAK